MQKKIDDQFNIGHICTTLQCEVGNGEEAALIWITPDLNRTTYSFTDLDEISNQIANALIQIGFGKKDKIFLFTPKKPEQIFAFLGILKIQAIACILFPTFGHDALLDRIGDACADCVITSQSLLHKILDILPQVSSIKKILLIDSDNHQSENILSLQKLLETASKEYHSPITSPDSPSVIHYTSGSTGKPKGALHVHRSILSQSQTFLEVFQPQPRDKYWCTADQAWVTGVSYGIIAPWANGISQIHYAGNYNSQKWLAILEKEQINIWYTAPTALRMLRQEDPTVFENYNLESLRNIFSIGEPLNPEIIEWSRRVLKKEIHDTFFQTETGCIMVSNRPGLPIKPGSMGKPLQGIQAKILSDDGNLVPTNSSGHLCFAPNWSSMSIGYINNDEAYQKKFLYNFFHTGDTAYQDEDGYIWFSGRSDDLIKTAGHLISPFEIESSLLEMDEIVESGIISVPDQILFEKIIAFVKLKKSINWSDDLELKIKLHVSNNLSTYASPREIYAVDQIPKNKSGKIMRRVLRARYLNLDEGDISTMEE